MTYADMAVTFLGAHWLGGLIWLAFGATALGLGVTIAQLYATQRRGHC